MRRMMLASLVLLLAFVSGRSMAAPLDDDDDDDMPPPAKKSSSWWPGWLSWGKKAEKKKEPEVKPAAKPVVKQESPATLRARAWAEYERRDAVCRRLRLIALQTNDEDLERRAEQLEQKAWEIYLRQTAHLGNGDLDEAVLERHLGADARRRTPPPDANSRRTSGASRAALREDDR